MRKIIKYHYTGDKDDLPRSYSKLNVDGIAYHIKNGLVLMEWPGVENRSDEELIEYLTRKHNDHDVTFLKPTSNDYLLMIRFKQLNKI